MKAISKYLGNFGRYQAYVYALMFIPCAISGAQTLIFAFTGAVPNARCRTNLDTSNTSYITGLNYSQIQYSGKTKQGGSVQYCEYCANKSANCTPHACDHGFVYDESQYHSTVTMEYGLICDSAWLRETTTSLFMAGVLVGAAVFGMLADRFGRKTVFAFCGMMQIVTFNVVTLISSLPLYCFVHFVNGAVQHGVYLTVFTMTMELMGGLPRVICGIWTHAFFVVGYIYVGFVAMVFKDWRTLQLAAAIPAILYLPSLWFMPESIRWLTVTGRTARAKKLFLEAASWNKVEVDEKILDQELKPETEIVVQETAFKLFTHWSLARTTLIVFFSWFVASMLYYGLSLNTSDLPGDVYINYIISGVVEFPGYVVCIPMMEYWGRKPSLVICYAGAGLCCIASGLIPHSYSWAVILFALTGKMFAAAAFSVIFNYSAEVYPTVVRNGGTGLSSLFARIGSLLAPQIHLLAIYAGESLPIIIYGGFALAAAIMDVLLPETRNKELPETIEDGIRFNQRNKKNKEDHVDTSSSTSSIRQLLFGQSGSEEMVTMNEKPI